MTNAAAERLLDYAPQVADDEGFLRDVHEALAAERQEGWDAGFRYGKSVELERIRAALDKAPTVIEGEGSFAEVGYEKYTVDAILKSLRDE